MTCYFRHLQEIFKKGRNRGYEGEQAGTRQDRTQNREHKIQRLPSDLERSQEKNRGR